MTLFRNKTKYRKLSLYAAGFLLLLVTFYGCGKLEPERVGAIRTEGVYHVTSNSCTAEAVIVDLGSEDVRQHGFCWGVHYDATIEGSRINLGYAGSTGVFSSTIDDLEPNTTYYIRAYMISGNLIKYGTNVTFTTK